MFIALPSKMECEAKFTSIWLDARKRIWQAMHGSMHQLRLFVGISKQIVPKLRDQPKGRGQNWPTVTRQDLAVRHAAQPGDLALGQLARRSKASLAQCISSDFPIQHLPGLPVAHTAHAGQIGMQITPGPQVFDFVYQPTRKHGIKPLGNPRVQPFSGLGF